MTSLAGLRTLACTAAASAPSKKKSDEEKHADLKDVQNTIDAEKLNSRPKKPITASTLALHYVIGLLPVLHDLQYHSVS